MAVEVGEPAPDFTLRDERNQEVTLSSLRGTPVVLMFYALDFSPICQSENCALRDRFQQQLAAAGARVFGISRDSVWAHRAWKEQQRFTHSLLADMKGQVASLYGAWNEQLGLAERLTVVNDREGIVRYVLHHDIREERDHTEAIRVVQELAR